MFLQKNISHFILPCNLFGISLRTNCVNIALFQQPLKLPQQLVWHLKLQQVLPHRSLLLHSCLCACFNAASVPNSAPIMNPSSIPISPASSPISATNSSAISSPASSQPLLLLLHQHLQHLLTLLRPLRIL